jgi:hypothetical protein
VTASNGTPTRGTAVLAPVTLLTITLARAADGHEECARGSRPPPPRST